MSEGLKPCPFCGGEVYSSNAGSVWFVHCKSNSCYGGNYELYRSEEAAYGAWNKRSANRESFDAGWEYHKLLDASQARLSEAVKVLGPLVQYLEDVGPILASDIDMLAKAKDFLATIGEDT